MEVPPGTRTIFFLGTRNSRLNEFSGTLRILREGPDTKKNFKNLICSEEGQCSKGGHNELLKSISKINSLTPFGHELIIPYLTTSHDFTQLKNREHLKICPECLLCSDQLRSDA